MQPFQCDLQPEIPKHTITTHTQAHPKQLQATVTLRQKKNDKPTPAATVAHTRYLSSPAAATLHGKTQGFVLRLPPQLTTSLPHHFPSSPLPIVTTSLRHRFPSSLLPFLTTSHCHHFPSSPLPFVTTSLRHHFPSSPLPFVTTSLRHHSPSSSLPFFTASLRHHFPSSPLPFLTTSLRHHSPSSSLPQGQFHSFLFFCYVLVHCDVLVHYVLLQDLPPFIIVNCTK